MEVQDECYENAKPFLEKLQGSYVSIRLLENLSVKVLVETEKKVLKIFCNVYKGHLPLALGLLQYDAIFPLLSKPNWDRRIIISPNRHVLYKLQYNDVYSDKKAQMVKQRYDQIMLDIKQLTNILLNYLDFPKYVSKSRKSTFSKILSMIGQSSVQELSLYDVDQYLEKYCRQDQEARKNNAEMSFSKCFSKQQAKQIQKLVQTAMQQSQKKMVSQQTFSLTNVIYLDQQQYQVYADNLLWKIKVFLNLCVQCQRNPFSLSKNTIQVNKFGDVIIKKGSQKVYDDTDFLKKISSIKETNSKRVVIQIAKRMYLLFVGQFPESNNKQKLFEPTFGLIDQWKKQPVHQCLWKLFTKCFNVNLKVSNIQNTPQQNIPYLDWTIAILKTIIDQVYQNKQQS